MKKYHYYRKWFVLLPFITLLILCGCTTTQEKKTDSDSTDEGKQSLSEMIGVSTTKVKKAQTANEKPIIVSELAPERAVGENKLILPSREEETEVQKQYLDYPASLMKDVENPEEKMPVMLNFDATPLTEVVPLFSELLGFSFLIDPSVKGAVTMTVNTEMNAKETWSMFQHILWLTGAYCSMNKEFLHVMPFSKMPAERNLLVGHDPIANVEVAFLKLKKTTSAETLALVKPFMTKGATITNIKRLNTLLIVEAPTNMPKLRELVKKIDRKWQTNWPQISIRCHSVDSETIIEELMYVLPVIGLPVTKQKTDGVDIKLIDIPRLQVIIASAPTADLLKEIERWVKLLDREDIGEQEHIYFYNVKHSTIEELHAGLDAFFNTSGTSRTRKTGSVSEKASSSSKSRTIPRRTSSKKPEDSEARSSAFEVPVTVHEDGIHNRLVIRTTPRAYALVVALLKRLDIPPAQVLIQALIVDVTLTEGMEYGFSYAARTKIGNNVNGFYGSNSPYNNTTTTTTTNNNATTTTTSGITFDTWKNGLEPYIATGTSGANLIFSNKNAAINFILSVAGTTNTQVLSAPQIIATSDEEAVIDVGESKSIMESIDNPGDTNETKNYGYKDAGIVLTVTPHITANNEVSLALKQTVDNFIEDRTPAEIEEGKGMTIQKRSLDTQLIVPDGKTVLMGGMIKSSTSDSVSGLPFLKDLPWIGNLFKHTKKAHTRDELLILITVNVVDQNTKIENLIKRYKKSIEKINKVFSNNK
ncbi:MAG: hypothetical protein U9O87_05410 [Verrucomicrobiota bacterium]|nr:hypothetical protein [Verrucomicrobiota bacterium]